MEITAAPLEASRFAPYGRTLEARGEGRLVNGGMARRHDFLAEIASHRPGARLNACVFRCRAATSPLVVPVLERHPASAQVFVPMAAERYVVVVANGGDAPDLASVRAFVASGKQGIVYAPGVWHAPMVAVDRETDFASFVWEDGSEGDCAVHTFETEARLRVLF